MPADALRASVQIAWGGPLSPTNMNLSLLDAQGTQAIGDAASGSGLTGRRQRTVVNMPSSGTWIARVSNVVGPAGAPLTNSGTQMAGYAQDYVGTVQVTSARYPSLTDLAGLDSSATNDIWQNFRSLVMSPIGSRFRGTFAVTRADLAKALVLGGRVPQYLPSQSSFGDVRDDSTMLFVESAQNSPNGALFPTVTGGSFQPDASVDRLTAVIALVRAAGLRQQAESGSYPLTVSDALSIPSAWRGYVAVAIQTGLIKTNGTAFNPQGSFTRLDLSRGMAKLANLASQ
jgi:hypothetical protein